MDFLIIILCAVSLFLAYKLNKELKDFKIENEREISGQNRIIERLDKDVYSVPQKNKKKPLTKTPE